MPENDDQTTLAPAPQMAPAPDMGNILSALGGMSEAFAVPPAPPQFVPQPYDPAAILAEMPSLSPEAQEAQYQQQFHQQPQAQLQQEAPPQERRRRRRDVNASPALPARSEPTAPEPAHQALVPDEPASENESAQDVLLSCLADADSIADDDDVDEDIGELAEIASDGFKALFALISELRQELAQVRSGAGLSGTAASTGGSWSHEEALAVLNGLMVGLSFYQVVTARNKVWGNFVRSLAPQDQEILKHVSQQFMPLVEQAHNVLQARTGVSFSDVMAQSDPEQIRQVAQRMGIQLSQQK